MNHQKILDSIKLGKFKILYEDLDKLVEICEKKIQTVNKIKLTLWVEEQTITKSDEHWADKMKPSECRKLFEKFLVLYEKAHGEKYDGYEPTTRSYHFENFKAYMMWQYRHFLERKND